MNDKKMAKVRIKMNLLKHLLISQPYLLRLLHFVLELSARNWEGCGMKDGSNGKRL